MQENYRPAQGRRGNMPHCGPEMSIKVAMDDINFTMITFLPIYQKSPPGRIDNVTKLSVFQLRGLDV